MVEVKIDYSRCSMCKKCVEACAYGVLEWFEEQPVVTNPRTCKACLECTIACPVGAISVNT